jgi:hypothetical protein
MCRENQNTIRCSVFFSENLDGSETMWKFMNRGWVSREVRKYFYLSGIRAPNFPTLNPVTIPTTLSLVHLDASSSKNELS